MLQHNLLTINIGQTAIELLWQIKDGHQFTDQPSIEAVVVMGGGSIHSPLEAGMACDCFEQEHMAK